jgi:hypothetical protein
MVAALQAGARAAYVLEKFLTISLVPKQALFFEEPAFWGLDAEGGAFLG